MPLKDYPKQMSFYVAGPMTCYPDFNFPAFYDAQQMLEARGYKVWNPADKDSEKALHKDAMKTGDDKIAMANGFDIREAFMWDADKVIHSDGIYMLRGWEASPGARAEHAIACFIKGKHPDYQIMYQE